MKIITNTFILRLGVAIILLTHSLHGIFNNDVTNFGKLFLDQIGFAPFGVFIAWFVILSQVVGSMLLILNQFVKWISILFILILLNGIIFVHFQEGWYVVGAGRNGMEFSILLILNLLSILYQNKIGNNSENI
jgi:putative oxidoreductase